jgi:tetratricopeptide (TPR) repeat protein
LRQANRQRRTGGFVGVPPMRPAAGHATVAGHLNLTAEPDISYNIERIYEPAMERKTPKMQPKRFCLTLTALLFFLCSPAALPAQDTDPAPASEVSETGELKEIDRPEGADTDPASRPAQQSGESAVIKDANYWFDRGVLLSVYGNEKAAINAFQQATILAPTWSSPYFQLGVAFGENGQYTEALSAISKAIELDADRGAYYYGRARVYLLSGDPLQAEADFQKAAGLGDPDAIRYLKKQSP